MKKEKVKKKKKNKCQPDVGCSTDERGRFIGILVPSPIIGRNIERSLD